MVAWVVIDRQHLRQTSPSLFPCSHSHFGCHASRIPEEIIPFFSCTYVEPILQPLCFHIHVCNGGVPPPQPATFKPSNVPACFRAIPFLFKLLRTLLRFFALRQISTLLFSIDSALFAKNHPGWG